MPKAANVLLYYPHKSLWFQMLPLRLKFVNKAITRTQANHYQHNNSRHTVSYFQYHVPGTVSLHPLAPSSFAIVAPRRRSLLEAV